MKKLNAYPDYNFRRITDITNDDLKKMGAEAVAVDLDNTTVKDASYHLSEEIRKWISDTRSAGIPVIIVSNTYTLRASYLAGKMGKIPYIAMANKPHTKAIRKAAEILKVDVSRIAMIGDRLFTDVMAANKAGAISVKVEPIEEEKLFARYFRKEREKERKYLSNRT